MKMLQVRGSVNHNGAEEIVGTPERQTTTAEKDSEASSVPQARAEQMELEPHKQSGFNSTVRSSGYMQPGYTDSHYTEITE